MIDKNLNIHENNNIHKGEGSNKNSNIHDNFKENIKHEDTIAINKKESSFMTKILKYVLYLIFICTGLYIGKHIVDKMNTKNSDNNINTSTSQQNNFTNTDINTKPKSELKVMREDKNKYY